jgi:hypothetical protein
MTTASTLGNVGKIAKQSPKYSVAFPMRSTRTLGSLQGTARNAAEGWM